MTMLILSYPHGEKSVDVIATSWTAHSYGEKTQVCFENPVLGAGLSCSTIIEIKFDDFLGRIAGVSAPYIDMRPPKKQEA